MKKEHLIADAALTLGVDEQTLIQLVAAYQTGQPLPTKDRPAPGEIPVKTTRCRSCCAEFSDAEIEGRKACPACGSTRRPVAITQDVTLTLNWFELRILANWAEIAVKEDATAPASLTLILDRIRPLRPAGAPGLTLGDEMGQLHDAGIDATLTTANGDVLAKPPTKH